ncbi:MAG TPA: endo alpha-1,4 polygalactosaminidase [Hyphomicrobiaceae bacterium]|nr:endo alpha-1,4 polygalactosaminidase [Hyphomicrobiaceae bacterium]
MSDNSPSPAPSGALRRAGRSLWRRALAGALATLGMAFGAAYLLHASIDQVEEAQYDVAPQARHFLLEGLGSWAYQSRGLDLAEAARSFFDLLVVDGELDGKTGLERRAEQLKSLKIKPDGGRRLVLAHLSIGQAEDHRAYWNRQWTLPVRAGTLITGATRTSESPVRADTGTGIHSSPAASPPLGEPTAQAPPWLGSEDPLRRGSYAVRYWHPGWQSFLMGQPDSAIDRAIAAGFDGVHLRAADAFVRWSRERPEARADMIDLIGRLSAYARERAPGFIVVLQDADTLLDNTGLLKAVDAVAKENLFFGAGGDELPNPQAEVSASLARLKLARRAGLPVLVLEHLGNEQLASETRRKSTELGFVPYVGPRKLDRLVHSD